MKTNEEYDLAVLMDQYLDPHKVTKNASANAVEQALDSLNKAAEILDAMGNYGASEVITKMMEYIPYVMHKAEQPQESVDFIKEASVAETTQQELNAEMLQAVLWPK